MIIKKHKTKNQYILSGDVWVRNFTKEKLKPLDINELGGKEYNIFIENELANTKNYKSYIDSEPRIFKNVIIVSDGLDFETKQHLLANLNYKEYCIIAVNGALANWNMVKGDIKRAINYYLINNPYPESRMFLPKNHRYYPKCIASTRTYYQFLPEYHGDILLYSPTTNENYSGFNVHKEKPIDDYRNPICAALHLCHYFQASKILLFCCDDAFKDEKPSSSYVRDAWCYEQQTLSNSIIDGCLYWLKENKIKLGYHCSATNFENATYINYDEIEEFFVDKRSVDGSA